MNKTIKNILRAGVAAAAILLAGASVATAQLRVLRPSEGGTGIGSATVGQVGTCLQVLTASPFTYALGTCGSGGGSAFPFTPTSNFNQAANSTSTQLWLTGSPVSLSASSTIQGATYLGAYGSVSAPTYSFTLNPATGMWADNPNQVTIAANGTEAARFLVGSTIIGTSGKISNPGNTAHISWNTSGAVALTSNTGQPIVLSPGTGVGVGTTSPAATLAVQGSALISGDITSVASVTATGTLTVAGAGTSTFSGGIDAARVCITGTTSCLGAAGGGAGTVTSVATNNGLTGGTITTSGTIGLDVSKMVSGTLTFWNGTQLAATGTQPLTVGSLIATTTATSTFAGGVDAARVCITGTTQCLSSLTSGTVTSVGLSLPSFFAISNSPVTTSGTLTGSISQPANALVGVGSGGTTLVATGTPQLTVGNLLATSTSAANTMSSFLNVGSAPFLTQAMLAMSSTSNSWIQAVIQNRTASNGSSALYAVQNDLGTNTTYFGEFGMNSSLFNSSSFSGQGAGDVFLGASDSSLDIGTASSTAGNASTSINFFTKGWLTSNLRMTILGTGQVGIGTSSPYAALSVVGSGGVVADHYVATSTASSTFAGGIDAARVCITGTTNCLGGGGSGKTVNSYFASTSISTTVYPYWTFSVVAGHTFMFNIICDTNLNSSSVFPSLDINVPGVGTTSIAQGIKSTTGFERIILRMNYTFPNTGTAVIALDRSDTGVVFGVDAGSPCRNPEMDYLDFSN